jgi:hypothetical protein
VPDAFPPALPKPLGENAGCRETHNAMKAGRVRSGQFLSGPVHNLRLARPDEWDVFTPPIREGDASGDHAQALFLIRLRRSGVKPGKLYTNSADSLIMIEAADVVPGS